MSHTIKVKRLSRGTKISFLEVDGRLVEIRVGHKMRDGARDAGAVMDFVLGRLKP